jgi:hypothetical protein
MKKAPKFKNRLLKIANPAQVPDFEKTIGGKPAILRTRTEVECQLRVKDMQNLHRNMQVLKKCDPFCAEWAGCREGLCHEHGDKSQQKHQNAANYGQNDGHHRNNGFNGICFVAWGLGFWVGHGGS